MPEAGSGRAAVVWGCWFALVASFAPPVFAQSSSADYDAVVVEGVREFQAGNWAEAKTLFREAHRLDPNARTLRGLGLASYELRQYVEAVDYLERALVDQRKPLTEAQRKQTQQQLARAKRFVAYFTVTVSPPDATLTVDGEARAPVDGQLLLAAGERDVTASAPGHRTERRRVIVEGGERGELSFRLVPDWQTPPPAAGAPARPPAEGTSEEPSSTPVGAIVVTGIGAALLVGSAVTGPLTLAAKSDLEEACGDPRQICDSRHEDKADRVESLALATDILWISGAAVAIGGIVWWVLGSGGHEADSASLRVGVSDRAAFVRLDGRF